MEYEFDARTKLIFAMPGSGKTSLVKLINGFYSLSDRPVIDYDYRGPRRMSSEVAYCQSLLLNAWAKQCVKAIFTFPQFLDIEALDRNLFKVIFALPVDAQVLAKRVVARHNASDRLEKCDHGGSSFVDDYISHCTQYLKDWRRIAKKFIDAGFDVEFRDMLEHQYLSDVILLDDLCDDLGELWSFSGLLGTTGHRFSIPARTASSSAARRATSDAFDSDKSEIAKFCLDTIDLTLSVNENEQFFNDTNKIIAKCLPKYLNNLPPSFHESLKRYNLKLEPKLYLTGYDCIEHCWLKNLSTGKEYQIY